MVCLELDPTYTGKGLCRVAQLVLKSAAVHEQGSSHQRRRVINHHFSSRLVSTLFPIWQKETGEAGWQWAARSDKRLHWNFSLMKSRFAYIQKAWYRLFLWATKLDWENILVYWVMRLIPHTPSPQMLLMLKISQSKCSIVFLAQELQCPAVLGGYPAIMAACVKQRVQSVGQLSTKCRFNPQLLLPKLKCIIFIMIIMETLNVKFIL